MPHERRHSKPGIVTLAGIIDLAAKGLSRMSAQNPPPTPKPPGTQLHPDEAERLAKRMFGWAENYYQAALAAGRGGFAGRDPMVPMLVQAALAVEIYLKALYVIFEKKIPKRQHKHGALFEELPEQEKAAALGQYPCLLRVLKKGEQTFEVWRYGYEHIGTGTIQNYNAAFGGQHLLDIIRYLIFTHRPQWFGTNPPRQPVSFPMPP